MNTSARAHIEDLETQATNFEHKRQWLRAERLQSRLIPLIEAEYGAVSEETIYALERLANTRSWIALGSRTRRAFWTNEAVTAYTRSIAVSREARREERLPWTFGHLAELYARNKQRDLAAQSYETALSLWTDEQDPLGGHRLYLWRGLVDAYVNLARLDDAEELIKSALKITRGMSSIISTGLYGMLARIHKLQMRLATANRDELESRLACKSADTPEPQSLSASDRQAVITPCAPVLLQMVAHRATFHVGLQEGQLTFSTFGDDQVPQLVYMVGIHNMWSVPQPFNAPLENGEWHLLCTVVSIDYQTGFLTVEPVDGAEFVSPHRAN